MTDKKKKVVFCIPTLTKPFPCLLSSLADAIPVIVAAGWDEGCVQEVGNPYVSAARAIMTRKALDAGADVIVYLDHDMAFRPEDLLKLIETDGECVSGTYRFKKNGEQEEYMGTIHTDGAGMPIVRADGCIKADKVPAGFLKLTKGAIQRFMKAYPELLYGDPDHYSVDLFNHGAHKGVWYGEDYAFSRNWADCGGQIWLIPDLNLDHHSADTFNPETRETVPGEVFAGNYHEFLMRQPGGSNDPNRGQE